MMKRELFPGTGQVRVATLPRAVVRDLELIVDLDFLATAARQSPILDVRFVSRLAL